jgi:hypothetical protein
LHAKPHTASSHCTPAQASRTYLWFLYKHRLDEQIRKLDEQLMKFKDQLKKTRPGPGQEAIKRRALQVRASLRGAITQGRETNAVAE